ADNPESFLEKHGGKEKVLADADLKRAYERRVQVRTDFLDLMRAGFKKYKKPAPFDQGEKAEVAGTLTKPAVATGAVLAPVMPCPGAERNWPRFRGPSGQGEAAGYPLGGSPAPPTEWDAAGKNILWRTKVPGHGNSSPVVW